MLSAATRKAGSDLDTGHNVPENLQVHAQLPIRAAGHLVAPRLQGARVGAQDHDEVIAICAIVKQLAHARLALESLQNGNLREDVHL